MENWIKKLTTKEGRQFLVAQLLQNWIAIVLAWVVISIIFKYNTFGFLSIFGGNIIGYILSVPYIILTVISLFVLLLKQEVGTTILSVLCVGSARYSLMFFLGCEKLAATIVSFTLWISAFILVLLWQERSRNS